MKSSTVCIAQIVCHKDNHNRIILQTFSFTWNFSSKLCYLIGYVGSLTEK